MVLRGKKSKDIIPLHQHGAFCHLEFVDQVLQQIKSHSLALRGCNATK